MIISKASLNLAVLCAADKHIPMMQAVCIEPDGSVVATNGKVVAAVSPVASTMVQAVPLPGKELERAQVVLSSATVRDIVKAIPKDTLFKGVLEHCAIYRLKPGDTSVRVEVTDGKTRNQMTVRTIAPKWIQYRAVFQNAFAVVGNAPGRVVLNRKRTALLMEMIDRVCPYDGDFAPVFWEFAGENVMVRAVNELTGQRMLAVLSSMPANEWPELTDWERKLLRRGAVKL